MIHQILNPRKLRYERNLLPGLPDSDSIAVRFCHRPKTIDTHDLSARFLAHLDVEFGGVHHRFTLPEAALKQPLRFELHAEVVECNGPTTKGS